MNLWRTGCALALVLAALGSSARGQETPSAAQMCLGANAGISLGTALPRSARRLKAREPLRIVAVGSSSTSGLWVLSADATYPEILRRELAAQRPESRIEIVNSGRVGDRIGDTIARFERDVLAHGPDLVIWQLGTNDVTWGGRAAGLREDVVRGVRTLKSSGEVILMDLQYAPLVLAAQDTALMQATISQIARDERVGLFSRFELMRRSAAAGLPGTALVSWDGLHNSAAGYECIGRALARAIDAAAR